MFQRLNNILVIFFLLFVHNRGYIMFRAYVDGSYIENGASRFGACIEEYVRGRVLGRKWYSIEISKSVSIDNVQSVECFAIWFALRKFYEKFRYEGIDSSSVERITIYSDALTVIGRLNSESFKNGMDMETRKIVFRFVNNEIKSLGVVYSGELLFEWKKRSDAMISRVDKVAGGKYSRVPVSEDLYKGSVTSFSKDGNHIVYGMGLFMER